jgi:hypothetical protein
MNGKPVTPAITPNVIITSGNAITFTSGNRRNLPFSTALVDDGKDLTYETIGSDANTAVFNAPVDGWYEISSSSCIGNSAGNTGLTNGVQMEMSAWVNHSGSETELRLDYAYASGVNHTLNGRSRRYLLRGDKVYISIKTSVGSISWQTGPSYFDVRLLSL